MACETINRTGVIGMVVDGAHQQAAVLRSGSGFGFGFGFKPVSPGSLRWFPPAKSLAGTTKIPRG
jgi:hypothetical protein